MSDPKIAVLIPCYNEAITIGNVVNNFKQVLPDAKIYVYDNNSNDETVKIATESGAIVRLEPMQGKGHVVRRMFRDIEADLYILVDGDDTYDAGIAREMVSLAINENYDVVNCVRRDTEQAAYRLGHRFGNQLLNGMVRFIFGNYIQDMLSGYKVLSRRFVKTFPVLSKGFDVETEIAIHALELSMPVTNIEGAYRCRPEGSHSKLNTYSDALRIIWLIMSLFKHERPMQFFSFIWFVLVLISLAFGIPVFIHYLQTGLVPRLPTAVLSTGIMLLAFLSLMTGFILDTVTRGRLEAKMLVYLQHTPYADRRSTQNTNVSS
jgi:glycosyltransferase involved in cell wall biosynthesis